MWGYFEDSSYGTYSDKGYFGLWKICKEMSYNREKCGREVSKFRVSGKHFLSFSKNPTHFDGIFSVISGAIFFSGVLAVISSILLGLFCVFSIIQIAMVSSREKVLIKYSSLVVLKLIFAIVSGKQLIFLTLH